MENANDSAPQLPEPVDFELRQDVQAFLVSVLAAAAVGVALWSLGTFGSSHLVDFDSIHSEPIPFEVDINVATWPELSQLPGIGETLGNRIVAHRNAQGRFCELEQLMQVKGIGPRLLEKMRPFVVIRNSLHDENAKQVGPSQ